jgi:arylsulfatase A-like enzyme
VHVPLLIKMPQQVEPEIVERVAQLADVAPTIFETVGLSVPPDFFGSVLAQRSRAVIAENYLAAGGSRAPVRAVSMDELDNVLPTQWALFEQRWKFVRNADGRQFLYDLSDDPTGSEDLASRRPEVTREMAERLAALLPPHVFTNYRFPVAQADVSSLTVEKLKSLGYAQ